jgi:transposase
LKRVFRDFVGLCVKPGLYGKELVATNGSKSRAVNSKERNFTVEKLRDRIARLEGRREEYLKELTVVCLPLYLFVHVAWLDLFCKT